MYCTDIINTVRMNDTVMNDGIGPFFFNEHDGFLRSDRQCNVHDPLHLYIVSAACWENEGDFCSVYSNCRTKPGEEIPLHFHRKTKHHARISDLPFCEQVCQERVLFYSIDIIRISCNEGINKSLCRIVKDSIDVALRRIDMYLINSFHQVTEWLLNISTQELFYIS